SRRAVDPPPSREGPTDELQALLVFLCPEPASARPAVYARVREKLEGIFAWRGCADPQGLADETFDRVARKVLAGFRAETPMAYVLGVARHVALEAKRHEARSSAQPIEAMPAATLDATREVYLQTLDQCLATLPEDERALLLAYHQGDGRQRIDGRRALAERIGLPLTTLRVRAHRIRRVVERCLKKCLPDVTDRGSSTEGIE
ncbi:MAG: hypothetical protein AAF449_21225, partial [Myxococcota bacterium]